MVIRTRSAAQAGFEWPDTVARTQIAATESPSVASPCPICRQTPCVLVREPLTAIELRWLIEYAETDGMKAIWEAKLEGVRG